MNIRSDRIMEEKNECRLIMCDEAQLRTVIADTVRDVMKQAKAEAEAAREMATMTREEVAKLFNVTKPTLWRWKKTGYLVPKRAGNRVLYLKSDVERMLQKGGNHE